MSENDFENFKKLENFLGLLPFFKKCYAIAKNTPFLKNPPPFSPTFYFPEKIFCPHCHCQIREIQSPICKRGKVGGGGHLNYDFGIMISWLEGKSCTVKYEKWIVFPKSQYVT